MESVSQAGRSGAWLLTQALAMLFSVAQRHSRLLFLTPPPPQQSQLL
jgi:hypothetical protein